MCGSNPTALFERRGVVNTHLGLHIEAAGPGWRGCHCGSDREVLNPFGAAHGGSVCALIDFHRGTTSRRGTLPDDRIRAPSTCRCTSWSAAGRCADSRRPDGARRKGDRHRAGGGTSTPPAASWAMGTATFKLVRAGFGAQPKRG